MIFDKKNNNCSAGLFQFTAFSVMTTKQKDDLDFLPTFFHDHKKYVNSLSYFNSAGLRGKLNMMGWRKCMKPDECVGIYLSQPKINRDIDGFDSVVSRGHCAGLIIGKSFKQLAGHAFTQNYSIMVKNHMPGFGDPNVSNSLDNNFC
ncbi:hypothetical protein PSHT_11922 [Puccinia striiformis]|uniref:Uncharacterized protein n=2 Tax=Puccinia striiformis TaxID=27350 RepID=A0A2S4UIA2_9BASI|nr:hypothetical protein PSTT_15325 [Puccinia striiformis]POW02896.1 hypothetical protein PSHT_11922 [Puccinia striiformis]